jgi:MFS transporter, DHA1 family, tetracycline resistance protein
MTSLLLQMENKKAFTIIFLTVFIDLLGFGLVIPILPTYAKELGATNIQVGFLAGIFSAMNFFFTPFLGSYSDRVGRRPIILLSIAANVIGYLIFGIAGSLTLFVLSRLVNGIGSSNIAAAQAYISDITKPEDRTKYLGMIGAAFGLGFVFGPAAGGFIKAHYGFQWVGFTAAILCGINFLSAYFFLPESIKEKNADSPIRFVPFKDYFNALQKPLLREILTLWIIYIMAFTMMQTVSALLWKEHYGLDEKHIGFVFAIIGIASAVAQGGLVGILSKRLGTNKILLLGCILMFIGLGIIPLVPKDYFWSGTILWICFTAIGGGCLTPSLQSLVSLISPPNEQGRMLGLSQSLGALSRVVGPAISGFAYDIHFSTPYFIGSGLMVVCFFLANMVIGLLNKRVPT